MKEIVDGAHHIALATLSNNKELLEETAQLLLQKEILEGAELRERLNRAQAPADMEEWLRSGKLPQDQPLMQSVLV